MLERGNLPLADITCRAGLRRFGPHAELLTSLAAVAVRRYDLARDCLRHALALQPDHEPARRSLRMLAGLRPPAVAAGGVLLIKCWGYGFWSNVDHVLGQLLLAAITGRTPVIHWGVNCRFGGSATESGFEQYFAPVSPLTQEELAAQPEPYFPPKWTRATLRSDAVGKWRGPFSRMAALYFLGTSETLAVSDFYTRIVDLLPWVPPSSDLWGSPVDAVYRRLVDRHLHPQPAILAEVGRFYAAHMAGRPWLAVHVRGLEKSVESHHLRSINDTLYDDAVARHLAALPDGRILLITDDQDELDRFRARYGPLVLSTGALRARGGAGVHQSQVADGHRLGRDVMVDTYLAVRCDRFVGNGQSNLSAMMPHLKTWPSGHCELVVPSLLHSSNTRVFRW